MKVILEKEENLVGYELEYRLVFGKELSEEYQSFGTWAEVEEVMEEEDLWDSHSIFLIKDGVPHRLKNFKE